MLDRNKYCSCLVFIPVLLMLLFSACSRADHEYPWPIGDESVITFDDDMVAMSLVEGSLSPNAGEFLVISNRDDEVIFGEPYYIEIEINGKWREIKWYDTEENKGKNFAWTAIGFDIRAHSDRVFPVDWGGRYGDLPRGKYRFIKDYIIPRNERELKRDRNDNGIPLTREDHLYVCCPFTIE